MAVLYLSGSVSEKGEEIYCPLQSSVVLFIVKYCQSKINVIFVKENEDHLPSSHVCCYKKETIFDSNIELSSWENIATPMKNVTLPSIHQPELKLIRSGLCVVLRHIIKDAHKENPTLNLIDLLGFRQGSMKMCAEVSSWTKLCEVDIPESVSQLMVKMNEMKSDRKALTENHWLLPSELMTLEKHFSQKCRVHNDNKRMRAEVLQVKDIFEKWEEDKPSCSTAEEILDRLNSAETAEGNLQPSFLNALSFDDSHLFIKRTVQLSHGVRKCTIHKTFEKSANVSESAVVTNDPNSPAGEKEMDNGDKKKHLVQVQEPFDFSDLKAAVMDLSFTDIEYEHVYSEGIELTIADLILIPYIHFLLSLLDVHAPNLLAQLPCVKEWTEHMLSLGDVKNAGQKLGWNVEKLQQICQLLEIDNKASNSCDLIKFQVVEKEDEEEEEEEIELSRNIKMKHKALKPEVLLALKKFEEVGIEAAVGMHPKGDDVMIDWESLPDGVHPKEGSVPVKRTQRKCQQLENLATAVQAVAKPGDVIVDFCSGGGHLGILCAYLLPQCQIYLVENKEESLLKSSNRLQALSLENVTLYQCNMDYFIGKFDVGLCLHACGSATDMVVELCTKSQASFVICPCCYGGIHNTHLLSYPRSDLYLQADISYTDFLTIGHAADQTEFDIKLEKQGRTCMNLVDTDRLEYAKQQDYDVTLCSLKPLTCSPKNNLLIGTRRKPT